MPSVRLSLSKFVAEYRNEGSRHIWSGEAVLAGGFMGRRGDQRGLPFALGVWQL